MWHNISLAGRVVRDPDTRYTPAGTCVSNFTVAVEHFVKDDRKTIWIKVVAWGKLGEFVMERITKGMVVIVEGHFSPGEDGSPRIWTGKDGSPRANYEVNAEIIRVMSWGGSKPNRDEKQEDEAATDETGAPEGAVTPKEEEIVAPF